LSSTTEQLVREIHAAPIQLVLAATGGGSGAIVALLETPGASRRVLEAIVPYSAASLAAWLGARPEHYCSQRTARAMAMSAFQKARGYVGNSQPQTDEAALAGVACTASLASDRPKQGPHRLHLALQTASFTAARSLELSKGRRTRLEEERLTSALLLNLIAEAAGIERRIEVELSPEERIVASRADAPQAWQDLLAGKVDVVDARAGDRASQPGAVARPVRRAILAGAFNPCHDAHRDMARIASDMLGAPVEFELSIWNVDKPPLDYLEIAERAAQFGPGETLWLSRAATFLEKAAIFAPATFVVGADTIARIADAKYYGGELACRQAIEKLAALDCRFLVFGRLLDGGFVSLADLRLPETLRKLCDGVPAAAFRRDLSSTELRRPGKL
jgi:nicotinamide mononucleotide (NMN) deamidase PncC